jgi:hypothetical protein
MHLILLRPELTGLVTLVFSLLAFVLPAKAFAANDPPSISGNPPTTATVGVLYSFRPTASDRNGDPLSFSIVNKPGWASFDPKTGKLSGTPKIVGVYASIRIWVSDGTASRSLDGFSITVKSATTSSTNSAPKISGTPPASAVVNKSYSFQPTASDANGDALTFKIVNKPGWAAFDTKTGRLYGTPSSTSTGSYSNVTISVTDGKATASLAPFTIKVTTESVGKVTLSWTAPTKNTDGTTLTNLAGYRVYYGKQSGQYTQTLSLPSPSFTSVSIEDLASGTWYFAVKALASDGDESSFSGQVSKSL